MSEPTLVKMSNYWKSHAAAHMSVYLRLMSYCLHGPLLAVLIEFRMIYVHLNHARGRMEYCLVRVEATMFLQRMQVSGIDWKFAGSVLLPFFKRGQIWALFQSVGTISLSKDV